MRKLIIMRHAEAADAVNHDDKGRTLTRYGHSQAGSAGVNLRHEGHIPDILIHSDATRILQTRDDLLRQWIMHQPELIADPRLYNPLQGLNDDNLLHFFLRIMDQADNEKATLMVLAHNPEIARIAMILNGSYPQALATNYPSATACVFTSSADRWYHVAPENSQLRMIIRGGEDVIVPKHPHPASRPAGPAAPEAK